MDYEPAMPVLMVYFELCVLAGTTFKRDPQRGTSKQVLMRYEVCSGIGKQNMSYI